MGQANGEWAQAGQGLGNRTVVRRVEAPSVLESNTLVQHGVHGPATASEADVIPLAALEQAYSQEHQAHG